MISDQAVINRLWSRILLEELARLGVRDVCIAPGSRSTPLALEADANTRLCLHPHFDERGLGYLALGLAKASHQPVAVIVTSGTAVANLLPAVAESKLTGEKLVVLTADRPGGINCLWCQSGDCTSGHFSHHVTYAVNLPSPTTAISPSWLLTTIDQAMSHQFRDGGAIHLNCPFPEPLYADQQPDLATPYLSGIQDWVQSGEPYSHQSSMIPSMAAPGFPSLEATLLQCKGVVIIGSLDLAAAQQVKVFAQALGWPVLCDPQSGVSSAWAHFDLWLQHPRLAEMLSPCEVVIQFGAHLVSKRLNCWLHSHIQSGCRYVYVSPDFVRDNPHHLPQQHVVAEVSDWVAHHMPHDIPREVDVGHHDEINVSQSHAHGWANELLTVIRAIPRIIAQRANQVAGIVEMDVAISIVDLVPQADLFIGNSLIVRLVDMLGQHQDRAVYSNRGLLVLMGWLRLRWAYNGRNTNP
ncbi:2-succinyl-5-enolpyruvyl-6-hydroxy-3-cyclohexene-1-carboxylic-acid synthase [Vibrio sp. PP-XX7]